MKNISLVIQVLLFFVLSNNLYGQPVTQPTAVKPGIQPREAGLSEKEAYIKERSRQSMQLQYSTAEKESAKKTASWFDEVASTTLPLPTRATGKFDNTRSMSKHELIVASLRSSISLIDKMQDSLNVTLTLEAKTLLLTTLYELSEQSVASELPTSVIRRDNESFVRAVFKPTAIPSIPVYLDVTQKRDTVKNDVPKKRSLENQTGVTNQSFRNVKVPDTKLPETATPNNKQIIAEETLLDKFSTLFSEIVNLHVVCADYKVQVFIEGLPNFLKETSFSQPVESGKVYVFRYGRPNSSSLQTYKYAARKFPKDQDVPLRFK